MSGPSKQHLLAIDLQPVFGDPDSEWCAPRFGEILPRVAALAEAFAPRVTFTRFVAPAEPSGAWRAYYERFAWARQPPDAPLYALVDQFAAHRGRTLDRPTFGKWGPALAERLDGADLVLAGVATDCCVISTALAAADDGVRVLVAADACAGASDDAHERALAIMDSYAPLIEVVTAADLLAGPA